MDNSLNLQAPMPQLPKRNVSYRHALTAALIAFGLFGCGMFGTEFSVQTIRNMMVGLFMPVTCSLFITFFIVIKEEKREDDKAEKGQLLPAVGIFLGIFTLVTCGLLVGEHYVYHQNMGYTMWPYLCFSVMTCCFLATHFFFNHVYLAAATASNLAGLVLYTAISLA